MIRRLTTSDTALDQPSIGGVLEHVLGPWGGILVGVGLLVSVLGAYLAWTLVSCEVVVQAARRSDMPAWLSREGRHGAPIAAITVTSVLVQVFLLSVLGTTDAFTLAISLCSSLVLVPYLLSAGLSLKLAWPDRRTAAGWLVLAVAAIGYSCFLMWAGGAKYLLLTCVVYAPGTILHAWARRGDGGLSSRERWAAGVVALLGGVAVLALVTGRITL